MGQRLPGTTSRRGSSWRWGALFFLLALLQGLIFAAVVPPWQSPDEHTHYEYAWLVSQHGPLVGRDAISIPLQQRVLASMERFNFRSFAGLPEPERPPTRFMDPDDPWLSRSHPQVGDERPLYYAIYGGLLQLAGAPGVVVGLYIGRFLSLLLFALSAGVVALTSWQLFPGSRFMQIVPPSFVVLMPMVGQMGASVNSDTTGILTSSLFFLGLAVIFRSGWTWKRGGIVAMALLASLLSKKTTLFLVPTLLLALPVYLWTRDVRLPRRARWGLGGGAVLAIGVALVLGFVDVREPADWVGSEAACGPTWSGREAYDGQGAFRIGDCSDGFLSQGLYPDGIAGLKGEQVVLRGWVRSVGGPASGYVSIADDLTETRVAVSAEPTWRAFTVTHTVHADARWVAVRLSREVGGGALLIDQLVLVGEGGQNLVRNGSAERRQSLLFDLVSDLSQKAGAPRRLVERFLSSQSWRGEAWRRYREGAAFCFRSFWGAFGWLAMPIPSTWYTLIGGICALSILGNLVFLAARLRRGWQNGYVLLLMGALVFLAVQTLLPMVNAQVTYWMPQGRYTFSGILAIATVLVWGWHQLLPSRWERWGTAAVVALMAGFDWLCLVWVVIPYFYGG